MKRQTFLSMLGALLTLAAPVRTQQPFRAAVDVVQVPVVVLAKDGQPVRGLAAADFDVFEDGRPQPVTFFAAGAPGPDIPLHLGLMLDRSESMELDLKSSS